MSITFLRPFLIAAIIVSPFAYRFVEQTWGSGRALRRLPGEQAAFLLLAVMCTACVLVARILKGKRVTNPSRRREPEVTRLPRDEIEHMPGGRRPPHA